ncbi:MAG: hypothetical protein PHF86_04240 [Candidatus Nanoarchaeia archaeon]|jgi:hypothetical protein|nr:hypothetical protein [Candidatus Nanoarchaeia archaeon]
MERVLYQEKPDFIRFEDEEQILMVAPVEWIMIKKNKESEEKEEIGRYKTFDEAKNELRKLVGGKGESD